MSLSEKRELMFQVITELQQSGMTRKEFARSRNIALSKLMYWVKKSRQNASGDFIQLSPADSQGIVLRFPNGVELMMPPQTPVHIIKGLVNM
jgi:hypothetical protein